MKYYALHTHAMVDPLMKLLVRNLARSTSAEELKELFEQYGTVQSCDLVADKITGGF